jgi:ERCC4-type nuclease
LVGVERKKLSASSADLIASMHDRRLQGLQLRGMAKTYDYLYLVVEGIWRPSLHGAIEVSNGSGGWRPLFYRQRGVEYRQVDGFLDSLSLRANVHVIRSATTAETASILANRYQRWQRPWHHHHSHDQIYSPHPSAQFTGRARIYNRDPGLVEKVAAQLPLIDRKAWAVGERFRSVLEMVAAGERDWREIDGIGKKTARAVLAALAGEEYDD